jgi:alpha-glucoside transport system permease protein
VADSRTSVRGPRRDDASATGTAVEETAPGSPGARVDAAPAVRLQPPPHRRPSGNVRRALFFLLPALVLLGAIVVYPIVYSIVRSLYGRSGSSFVGIDNYRETFESSATLHAIRNTVIWVVVAPTLATAIGLVFAVLSERVRWQTAFKVAVFMPMAISFLAAGVIFRFVYEQDPDRGVANAVVTSVVDAVRPAGDYPGARPSEPNNVRRSDGGFETAQTYRPGDVASIGMFAIRPGEVPKDARLARGLPAPRSHALNGVVWLDFTRGGGGQRGAVDPTEKGLPHMDVEAVRGGESVASTTSGPNGHFSFTDLAPGSYRVRLSASSFREPYGGVSWLGPGLITPSIIAAYLWIWVGFAMIVIGAGLAAIPREVLEAARTDGGSEWQVFSKVTAPLLRPVLAVVLVTLVINVLKIFDLVFVIAPPSVQDDANVIALEMWRVSFGGANDQGLGSALAVLLFVLVLPAMLFNIRRLRLEER